MLKESVSEKSLLNKAPMIIKVTYHSPITIKKVSPTALFEHLAKKYTIEKQEKVKQIFYTLPHINNFYDKTHLNSITNKFLDECSVKFMAKQQLKHIFIKKGDNNQFQEILFISDIYLHGNIQEVYVSPHPYSLDLIPSEHLKTKIISSRINSRESTPIK